jgi:ribonuclease HI
MTSDYYVYTDGACVNNGQENAMAGMGIYFGDDDPRNVSKRVVGKQSNNTAELGAIIEAYTIIKDDVENGKVVTIVSDSIYAIRCVTTYGEKCAAKGWSADIPNKDMVKRGYELYRRNSPFAEHRIFFKHIKAHTGKDDVHSLGNENADRLANMAIGLTHCPYDKPKEPIFLGNKLETMMSRTYLNVPFSDKEHAKKHGCRWDPKKKKWWISEMKPELEKYLR